MGSSDLNAVSKQAEAQASKLGNEVWIWLQAAKVAQPHQLRADLMTWRRGSAQMVLRVNAELNNVSIYSALVSGVRPNEALYKYLLTYNTLQRRESLGLVERDGRWFILLKYTMEMELATQDAIQRHVYFLQERADALDTELAERFGGTLRFEDWKKLDQKSVDSMIDDLFG
jgi:hypothetical protein